MQKLLFILIFVVGIQLTYGQSTIKNPEMEQEINELKKEIKELEDEIKAIEKTDPDEAKAMKSELSALKAMLGMLDKSSVNVSNPSKSQLQTTGIPSSTNFKSSIVPVSLKQPVTIPTAAQAKDKLLWYTGKKYNDSTLVTTKGMVVQFLKKENVVVLQPQKKTDPFDKIIQELLKSDQRKKELIDNFDKMKDGFLFYPELKKGLDFCDEINKSFNSLLKNTIELPVLPMPVPQSSVAPAGGRGRGPSEYVFDDNLLAPINYGQIPIEIEEFREQQLALTKKLISELPPVSDFPAPPIHEFGVCAFCDTSLLRKQEIQETIWNEKYLGKEREIAQILLGLERQDAVLGASGDYVSLLEPIYERMAEKNQILIDRYGNNARYIQTVSRVILGFERQRQLLGFGEARSFMEIIPNIQAGYDKYLDEQIEAKNHDFVLNYAFHIGYLRQKGLFGNDDGHDFYNLSEKIINYNRFALSTDLDFIYEERNDDNELDFKATGTMTTKEKVYAMLAMDECGFRMRRYSPSAHHFIELEDVSARLYVTSGVKTIRNEEDELENFSYSGPESFPLLFPDFKLDFCNEGVPDSAFFLTFTGDEQAANMYVSNINNHNKNYGVDFLGFVNLVFQNTDVEENENEFTDLGNEIINTISGFQNTNTGGSTLEKLKTQYEANLQMDNYRKNIQKLMADKKSTFLFTANNRSSVLIDKYNDTKRKLDDNIQLTRGLIHLRVVHDPVK